MKTAPNIPDPDGFYEAWLDALAGLSDEDGVELNARLVLLLANQVGEQAVLLDCIEAARAPFGEKAPHPPAA
jgi:hypothetical protein